MSDVNEIEPLVAAAVGVCTVLSMSPRACRLNIPVALTEALANAIIRGNNSELARRVVLKLSVDTQRVQMDVTDEGAGFDTSAVLFSPDDADWLEREDGRGLFLMRSLMDSVELIPPCENGQGHTVRLMLKRS